MKATRFILAGVALMVAACGNNEKDYDATGTFEATETTVFAEQSGTLLSFDVNEGDMIEATRQVGLIDTTQTWLKIQQMDATKAVYQSQKPDMERQIAVGQGPTRRAALSRTGSRWGSPLEDVRRCHKSGEGAAETVGCADIIAKYQHSCPRQADSSCRCTESTVAGYAAQVPRHDSHQGNHT